MDFNPVPVQVQHAFIRKIICMSYHGIIILLSCKMSFKLFINLDPVWKTPEYVVNKLSTGTTDTDISLLDKQEAL